MRVVERWPAPRDHRRLQQSSRPHVVCHANFSVSQVRINLKLCLSEVVVHVH